MTEPAESRIVPARPRVVSPGRIIALLIALIGFYVVWPSLVGVFGSFRELRHVNPGWFPVMVALEAASFLCIWALIGLCLRSKRYFLIGTSQLAGNSISRVLPGGTPSVRRSNTGCWSPVAWTRPASRPGSPPCR